MDDTSILWRDLKSDPNAVEALIHEAIRWVMVKHASLIKQFAKMGCEREDFYNEVFYYCWRALDRIDDNAPRQKVFNFFVGCGDILCRNFNRRLKRFLRKQTVSLEEIELVVWDRYFEEGDEVK